MVFKICLFINQQLQDKGTDYVIGWKSKGLSKFKLLPLYGTFLPSIKYIGYKIGIQLNNSPLVAEQISYANKTVNAYIVYDLDNWPKTSLRNFTLKNCLFGATKKAKNSDKVNGCIVAME